MEQGATDKLYAIATYLVEQIPGAQVDVPEQFEAGSPVCVLRVKMPTRQHRLLVSRALIEDQNRSVSELRVLMLRDGLADRLQAFSREEYSWNPVA